MPFRWFATTTGAGIAVTLALICLPCTTAQAQLKLTADYALSLAGVTIGEGHWAIEIGKDRYTAQSSGRLFGVWHTLLGHDIAATARGTAGQGRLGPTSYAANFSSDDNVEDVRIAFRDGNVSELEAKPPVPASADRIPITPAQLRGVVDPLTAGIVPMPGAGDILSPAACHRTLPIFDGTHRFDMALTFKRADAVKIDASYQGPAIVCAMDYRPVAGYTPGTFWINYLKGNHDMEMWFAPIAGTRLLAVVRLSIPTMLGIAMLKAVKFESANR